MGFDARVHPRLTEPPDITGQGFTAQKLQQSSQNLETINGRPFEVVTFKTAIAAARAGKFEIAPEKLAALVIGFTSSAQDHCRLDVATFAAAQMDSRKDPKRIVEIE